MNAGGNQPRWAELAYEAMAPAYDDFTAHHDYEVWLGNLLEKLELHGIPPGKRLLDVGCGTGKSFLPMLRRGWTVTACDISPKMVALAREKVGDEAELHVADMRRLALQRKFSGILAWDSFFHLCHTISATCFRCFARMRRPRRR